VPLASYFAGQKVVEMRPEKDLVKICSFVLNLIIAIAMQGEDDVFNTYVHNII
jgi:hypothetical protein